MKLLLGDCLEVMKSLEANSIDAIVTDPPYGWRFMGKAWDVFNIEKKGVDTRSLKHKDEWRIGSDGRRRRYGKLNVPNTSSGSYDTSIIGNKAFQKFTEDWAKIVFHVLKPGGHILVFCGPRTYHRMASGLEDAGFEIRDQLQWIFGSGFPKSLDISKAIDKAAGAEREVIGKHVQSNKTRKLGNSLEGSKDGSLASQYDIRAPATDAAKQWGGWGTALKPANEPIVLARKPLSEKTVAANVFKWGTGGLNIDACRIDLKPGETTHGSGANQGGNIYSGEGSGFNAIRKGVPNIKSTQGRFPANLILDEAAAEMLDEQTGYLHPSGNINKGLGKSGKSMFGGGGASRFFYVAKASKRERGEGNNHPTVKPIKLMEYLCRLITPPRGTILDPFMGSGTTGIAAKNLGFGFIGIEKEEQYLEIAKARIFIQ